MSGEPGFQHFNEGLGHVAAFQSALRLDAGMEAGRDIEIEAPEGFAFCGVDKAIESGGGRSGSFLRGALAPFNG
jgi:hypothetical protein